MNIIEFFELSAGKWFSQRTIHNLASGELQAGKSNLMIDILAQNDSTVVELCQHHEIDPATVWGGLRLSWEGTTDESPNQQKGSAVIVPIANLDHPQEGQLLQRQGINNKSILGRYKLDENDVLTFITESPNFYAEERFWYLMPNLRLRTSVVKNAQGCTQASFCSEIRMGVIKN